MSDAEQIHERQEPFRQILREELGEFLGGWDGCCDPNCLCEAPVPRPDRVGVAMVMWMSFFGGPDLFEAESEAIGLRARIQQRFVYELGALAPPQVP